MTEIDRIAMGKRIKKIRDSLNDIAKNKKKMTLEEFGKMMNPPAEKSLVSKWEKGIYIPNTPRLKTIAFLGNTTIDFILYGTFQESYGYGERIKRIREEELNMSKEQFAKSFSPNASIEDVSAWENELRLPPKDFLNSIAADGHISRTELLFGERKYKSSANPFNSLDKIEKTLEDSHLTLAERADSDTFFVNFNELRLTQIDDPEFFKYFSILIEILNTYYFPIENISKNKQEEKEYLLEVCRKMISKMS